MNLLIYQLMFLRLRYFITNILKILNILFLTVNYQSPEMLNVPWQDDWVDGITNVLQAIKHLASLPSLSKYSQTNHSCGLPTWPAFLILFDTTKHYLSFLLFDFSE